MTALLGLGDCNVKQLLRQLNTFSFTQEELQAAVHQVDAAMHAAANSGMDPKHPCLFLWTAIPAEAQCQMSSELSFSGQQFKVWLTERSWMPSMSRSGLTCSLLQGHRQDCEFRVVNKLTTKAKQVLHALLQWLALSSITIVSMWNSNQSFCLMCALIWQGQLNSGKENGQRPGDIFNMVK